MLSMSVLFGTLVLSMNQSMGGWVDAWMGLGICFSSFSHSLIYSSTFLFKIDHHVPELGEKPV